MKLKDEYKKMPKDLIYDMYDSLVYDVKYYDNITRDKMLDSIISEYKQEGYLYHICTERELLFLKYIQDNKLTKEDLKKYEWEINELNKKAIFSKVTLSVYEEQEENVTKALAIYNKASKKVEDDLVTFMVSVIKINGNMLTKAFQGMMSSMFHMNQEAFNAHLAHPLFHFYVDYQMIDFHDLEEEELFYREYWDELDELFLRRKEYGIAGTFKSDIRDNYDIFYYGFPIRNAKVKKMYDEVSKLDLKDFYFRVIDDARLLYDYDSLGFFIEDKKLLSIIKDALDEMPSGALNGFTPKNYQKELKKGEKLDLEFKGGQKDAHLTREDAKLFYKLYFALLEYTNNKHHLSSIKKIYKQNSINPNDLYPINEYLWKNKNIIDDFIKDNPYKFNNDELKIIEGFKTGINDNFVIAGYDEEYTKLLNKEGKLYMIKGINCNIEDIIPNSELPLIINTTLLMFKDKIIFNSFFGTNNIRYGNDLKEYVIKEMKTAIKYYHL